MSRKAFLLQVELDVQTVTCPGVWLCSNGKVALQIYMLESCVQTGSYKPNFPIQCNETFVFYKTFYSKHQLNELEKQLQDQWVYIELVQWQSCEVGHVLATFQTTLDDLLYPSTASGSLGVDLDLLMEPTKTFPGTIAPKIEVSTKTTIEETLCTCKQPTYSTVVVNPKVLLSTQRKPHKTANRKVCHSIGYSKKRRNFKPVKTKPPFRYRRAEDDLILRKPKYTLDNDICSCRQSRSLERRNVPALKPKMCSLSSSHRENLCLLCAKYKGYFNVTPAMIEVLPKEKSHEKFQAQPIRTNLYDSDRDCSIHSKLKRCPHRHPIAFATSEDKSESNASDLDPDDKKVCFCNCGSERKPSLAAKLHDKLTKTLSSIPKAVELPCYDYDYDECNCCDCSRESRAELYRDLQKFYGDLYEKSRNALCVPDCPGYK